MKIKVGDLKPNPFRRIKSYPICEIKKASLMKSMRETGFWNNLLARKNDKGEYEIAYGHHRIKAVMKEFGRDYVINIHVQKISDANMIRIMANENDQQYNTSPTVINETVKVAKKFLENNPEFRGETGGQPWTATSRGIAEFLGGNWHKTKVSDALASIEMLDRGQLDLQAFKSIKTQGGVTKMKKAIEDAEKVSGRKVNPLQQRTIAEDFTKQKISQHKMRDKIFEAVLHKAPKINKKPDINEFINSEFILKMNWLNARVSQLNEDFKSLNPQLVKKARGSCKDLIKKLETFIVKGDKNGK